MQIFFVEERQHWIATSLFKGELHLYDSCFNGTLSPSTELQIAQVYSPLIQCDGLLISVAALQQQEGANNYALFSIAAAYHAAMNDDVGALVFWRAHLIKCFQFEKGKLSRFPRTKKAMPKRPAPQTIAITIYCMCKRPDSFEDMVMCDRCSKWYHYRCAKIREEPVGNWHSRSSFVVKNIDVWESSVASIFVATQVTRPHAVTTRSLIVTLNARGCSPTVGIACKLSAWAMKNI